MSTGMSTAKWVGGKSMPLRATLAIAAALATNNAWAEAGTSGAGAGCVESARPATRHPATWYDTFAGTRELLNVYEGDRVVFYSPEDLEAEQYSCILAHLDSCMEMYSTFAGGAYPRWSPEGFRGKGSVALVENTCGAGCGAAGRAEVLKEYADRSVSRVGGDVSDPRGWQVSYYEMGRGGSSERFPMFPFYNALQLFQDHGAIASGFPHFMAHACMHRRGVSYEDQAAHFRRWEHHFPRENPPPHVFNGAYRALGLSFTEIVMRDNPELTLDPSSPPTPEGRRGVNHVFSMILTDLYREYGAPYVESYLEDLTTMDVADSAEAVEQNMLDAALGAHYATNHAADAVRRLQSVWRMNPDWRPRNRPPAVVETLPDRRLPPGARLEVDVSRAFRDPDGDPLTYTASSSAPAVVTVSVAGTGLTLTAVSEGTATIRVRASDRGVVDAEQTFAVTVDEAAVVPFTDDPIVPGVTPVRAAHFTELRTRIDALRRDAGLTPFRWMDLALRAGVTPVKLAHLLELRAALAAAYGAAGRAAPPWAPASESTPIRAQHVTELRAAVLALE